MTRHAIAALLLMLAGLLGTAWAQTPLDEGLALITAKDFKSKSRGIALLVESADERVQPILAAMLGGDLQVVKADKRLVIVTAKGRDYQATDALTGEDLGVFKRSALDRVAVNNSVRSELRAALAAMNLTHPDRGKRLASVEALIKSPDPALEPAIRAALTRETDREIAELLGISIGLFNLSSDDPAARLEAVDTLRGSLRPAARNALNQIAANDPDTEVREAAVKAMQAIEYRLKVYRWIETLFFGLSLGSVLVLAAIGLAITFGVMGVINMAHGELIMLGAYTTFVVQRLMPEYIDYSLWVAIPAAFLVAGAVGVLIERTVIRFLYGRPLETLLATFGVSLILQQTVRTIFSPLNQSVLTPSWMSGQWVVNSALSLTLNRLVIIGFCLAVFVALLFVLKRTALGLNVRAVAQNRAMARAMGVRATRVDMLTFGLGSGVAGVAGVALSQLTNVGPNLGQAYIIDSFMVVVFGGVGNLWGTLVAGLSLGVINKVLEPWSGAVLAKILVLIFIILFIQKRPRGLFPQRGRAAEA